MGGEPIAAEHAAEAKRLQALADPAPGRVLHVLCVLGVPDELLDGPRTVEELAEKLGADADALRRVLRAAQEIDVLGEQGDDKWALRPGGLLLCTSTEGSLRAEFADNDLFALWTAFEHSVRTGRPCYPEVFGAPLFERLDRRPDERRGFHLHMHARAHLVYGPLLGSPLWPDSGVVVDVGGGTGGLLEQLLAARPALSGVLYDLPEVLDLSPLRSQPRWAGRIDFVAGDIFAGGPPPGDVHVLGSVLHDWPDPAAIDILASCRAAARPDGRLIVLDRVLPDTGPRPAVFNDLLMLAAVGGKERTSADWHALAAASGFRVTAAHRAETTDLVLLEFTPAD
ncbi:MAG TPA: methyltransferase [Pseudonocardiaceae bacterium]|jgi:SAM-dependent methyltransferase|nr:methyltransferase [Pseudonocardiaceae bacterium]